VSTQKKGFKVKMRDICKSRGVSLDYSTKCQNCLDCEAGFISGLLTTPSIIKTLLPFIKEQGDEDFWITDEHRIMWQAVKFSLLRGKPGDLPLVYESLKGKIDIEKFILNYWWGSEIPHLTTVYFGRLLTLMNQCAQEQIEAAKEAKLI